METLRLRVASLEDAKRLFDWSQGVSATEPTPWGDAVWEDHIEWLELTLGPADQILLIGEAVRTDEAVGAVRFDACGEGRWQVAIIVAPEFRGRGWSRKLLRAGIDHLDDASFLARAPAGDGAVAALFQGLNFRRVSETSGVALYLLERSPAKKGP